MLWFKNKVHRDRAAIQCIEHCRNEAGLLRSRLVFSLNTYCNDTEEMPTIDQIASMPLVAYSGGKFQSRDKTLLEAHCYAIALASGLSSCGVVNPPSQERVMQWKLNRLIIEEDVGPENVGQAPSPRPRPGMHVSYAPGTFVHGTASLQQRLMDRYSGLDSAPERLTMLLLSLHVLRPETGVHMSVYRETSFGDGLIGRNKIGYQLPTPDQIDEWEEDLEITDADAALANLPAQLVQSLISAIESVDPFWPSFTAKHELTW